MYCIIKFYLLARKQCPDIVPSAPTTLEYRPLAEDEGQGETGPAHVRGKSLWVPTIRGPWNATKTKRGSASGCALQNTRFRQSNERAGAPRRPGEGGVGARVRTHINAVALQRRARRSRGVQSQEEPPEGAIRRGAWEGRARPQGRAQASATSLNRRGRPYTTAMGARCRKRAPRGRPRRGVQAHESQTKARACERGRSQNGLGTSMSPTRPVPPAPVLNANHSRDGIKGTRRERLRRRDLVSRGKHARTSDQPGRRPI